MDLIENGVHFTWRDDPAQTEPFMVCDACDTNLCTVEEGDSLDSLVRVAKDHARECVSVKP